MQADKIKTYYEILSAWNKSINLVGDTTIINWDTFYQSHITDVMALHNAIGDAAGDIVIADIGSGAGIPGLLLSIIRDQHLHLVEKNHKKASFMHLVAQKIGASVTIHNKTIEQMPRDFANIITARALSSVTQLLDFADHLAKDKATCYFLKGEKVHAEINHAQTQWDFNSDIKKYNETSVLVINQWNKKCI